MAFDTTALDAACLDIGDDAVWMAPAGPTNISLIITIAPDLDDSDGYGVLTDRITGETTLAMVKGLQRGDVIIQSNESYSVQGYQADSTGWLIIELEKL